MYFILFLKLKPQNLNYWITMITGQKIKKYLWVVVFFVTPGCESIFVKYWFIEYLIDFNSFSTLLVIFNRLIITVE